MEGIAVGRRDGHEPQSGGHRGGRKTSSFVGTENEEPLAQGQDDEEVRGAEV